MKKTIILLFVLILFLCAAGCTKTDQGAGNTITKPTSKVFKVPSDPKILIVYSYTMTDEWTKSIDQSLVKILGSSGYKYDKVYMNLVPGVNPAAGQKSGEMIKTRYDEYKPFVVIAVDDEAQNYFAKDLSGRDDVSIVFCGVESDPSLYNYPVHNVAGVLERPHVQQVLLHLKDLTIEADSYTILTAKNEKSTAFIKALQGMNLGLNMTINEISTFAEWKEKASAATGDVVIVYSGELSDENEEVVFAWTAENVSKPTAGFSESAVKQGILIAEIESGTEQGTIAGQQALNILKGRRASQLGIMMTRTGTILINKATGLKLGISENKISSKANILY